MTLLIRRIRLLAAFTLLTVVSTGHAGLIAEYTFEAGTYTGSGTGLIITDQATGDGIANDGTFAKTGTSVVTDSDRGSVLDVTSESGGGMHVNIDTAPGTSLSCSVWIKTTDADGYLFDNQSPRSVVSAGGSTGGNHGYYSVTDGWVNTGVAVPTDGQWHHYAYVLNDAARTLTVYLDGSLVFSTGISEVDNLSAAGAQVFFARYSDNMGVKVGLFDDLQIYDNAMSAEDVAAAMGATKFCQNRPVFDWDGNCVVDVNDLIWFSGDWLLAGGNITPPLPGEDYTVINDNGAWCWFEDERVIIDDGKVIVGSVASGGDRNGNIEIASYIYSTGQTERFVLHANLQADDHDSPALLTRADGRYLAMYSKHGGDNWVRYRISTNPHDITDWQPEQLLNVSEGATVGTSYCNIYRLSAENGGNGRIYNFHRCINWDPTVMYSDDDGDTWVLGGKLLTYNGDRPYVRYTSNNTDQVHFITTEGHPRYVNNSIYHGYVKNGKVYNTHGMLIDDNVYDQSAQSPTAYTQIFAANTLIDDIPMTRCWTVDVALDANDNPYAVFQARIDPGLLSAGSDSLEHLFFYARYDGLDWHVHKLAYAGHSIYDNSPDGPEDDYTGLAALVPGNPNTVYISTDVDPLTGAALISAADGQQRYEILEGVTSDEGATWTWTPITENSTVDNFRPIMPESDGSRTALLWMASSRFTDFMNYDVDVVGLMTPSNACLSPEMDFSGNCVVDLADFAVFAGHWLDCGWYPQSYCNDN